MSTAEIVFAALAVLTPIISVLIAYLGFRRNQKNDTKSEGQQEGVLQSDVGYIKSGVDRLEKRLDRMDEKESLFAERLTTVEIRLDEHIKDPNLHKKGSVK